MAAYRKAGVVNVSCFLNGNELVVYVERDEEIGAKAGSDPEGNEVAKRWESLMVGYRDPSFEPVEYEGVFHMFE